MACCDGASRVTAIDMPRPSVGAIEAVEPDLAEPFTDERGARLGHYLQSGEFPGFDYGDIQAAYLAGAKDMRQAMTCGRVVLDDLLERCADSYVKSIAPVRKAGATLSDRAAPSGEPNA